MDTQPFQGGVRQFLENHEFWPPPNDKKHARGTPLSAVSELSQKRVCPGIPQNIPTSPLIAHMPEVHTPEDSPPPYFSVEPTPPNQGGDHVSPPPDPYVILGAQMHAHILEVRQEMQTMDDIRIQSEAHLAKSIAESKDFIVQKLENSLTGLSKQVYALVEDVAQKIPADRPSPEGGGTVDPTTLTNLLHATSREIKADFNERSSKLEEFSMSMFQKLTNAQIESSKEMSKNFSDLHKATLEREKTMKEDLKKTHEVLHIMQGSIEETLTSHVGEIDAQKKHIDLVQKEVIKMRSDTSEALHLLAKKNE